MNLDFDGFFQTLLDSHWASKSAPVLLISLMVNSESWWEALVPGF